MSDPRQEATTRALHDAFLNYGANLARLNENDLDAVIVRLLAAADTVDPRTKALEQIAALEDQGRDLGTGMGPDYWAGVGEAADIANAALAAVKA